MLSFQAWALDVVGLVFKVAKDRVAAQQQLALGFVWDSTTLTRTIDERKLAGYLDARPHADAIDGWEVAPHDPHSPARCCVPGD